MGNLKLDDLNLFYKDVGSGYPIVLIHGMGSDHAMERTYPFTTEVLQGYSYGFTWSWHFQ